MSSVEVIPFTFVVVYVHVRRVAGFRECSVNVMKKERVNGNDRKQASTSRFFLFFAVRVSYLLWVI